MTVLITFTTKYTPVLVPALATSLEIVWLACSSPSLLPFPCNILRLCMAFGQLSHQSSSHALMDTLSLKRFFSSWPSSAPSLLDLLRPPLLTALLSLLNLPGLLFPAFSFSSSFSSAHLLTPQNSLSRLFQHTPQIQNRKQNSSLVKDGCCRKPVPMLI